MSDKMRPSAVIMTSGPGSILDLPERESRMVMGTAYWINHDRIYEPRLSKGLGVDHFGTPKERWDIDSNMRVGIPTRDFPFMRLCPKCGSLSYAFKCKDHGDIKTMPPRLVAACKDGHIQDFPWKWWCGCECSNDSRLYITGENIEAEGSDLRVVCKNCHQERTLMGALGVLKSFNGRELNCNGNRPWLGDREECNNKLYGLMRGASNVFFPVINSSLSIPPFSDGIQKDIEEHRVAARSVWDNGDIRDYIRLIPNLRKFIDGSIYTEEDLGRAFGVMYGKNSPDSIKGEEWDKFIHNITYRPRDDFKADELEITGSKLTFWFDRIVKVKKLREVVAMRGFTRIEPYNYDPETNNRIQDPRTRPENWSELLERSIKPTLPDDQLLDWLPGVEQFGEGIFFKFNESRVEHWLTNPMIIKRCETIFRQPNQPFKRDGVDTEDPRIILVHTFAHNFIRQLSLACGYPIPSLRERIYVGKSSGRDMCGVLIYTASVDSEGTLGGLVSQAKDTDRLYDHISNMLKTIKICSQDPLCGAHEASVTKNAWGAACHSCTHLPETSCEGLQNKLLDRFALVGNDKIKGYFEQEG